MNDSIEADSGQLMIIPSLHAGVLPNGQVSITQKFIAGVESYSHRWPGRVAVVMRSGPAGDNLDNIACDAGSLSFRLVLDGDLRAEIARSTVVLASATHDQVHVALLCRELGVPCAYVTEYSLRTRCQIVWATTRNPLLRLRRAFWEYQTERRMRRAIAMTNGVQCNGTPTHEAYRSLTPSPLLFFDTRSTIESLIAPDCLEIRLAKLIPSKPLRLFFSGRLIRIKGADHLLEVARHLEQMRFAFAMTICGEGDLSADMRRRIGNLPIKMTGVLDFERELQPLLKASADLFVCCHRQGDPSCTYLETMAAGVPIVAYDNEAFMGVNALANAGWSVPMNRPGLMAAKIASLTRDEIAAASRKALAFATKHSFEATFDARIAHLASLVTSRPGG